MGAKMVPPLTHFRVTLVSGKVEEVFASAVDEDADEWIFTNGGDEVKKYAKSEVASFVAD